MAGILTFHFYFFFCLDVLFASVSFFLVRHIFPLFKQYIYTCIKGLCTVKFVHTITIWEHSFLKGLPSPVPQYWYIEAILSPGVVLHKPHDNDIEAGSCHWIFNWYIFTCFLPRLFMLYSHWSWEWLYFAFLFSFNMRMLFSGTSKYLQTTAFFFICIYICVIFFTVSGPGGAEPGRARVSSRV